MATPAPRRPRADRRTKEARRDPAPSRELLLRAAARVFAERGFEGATVDEIAAQAGLSKGTLYWNFESKDELFLSLLEEHIDRRVQAMIELIQSAPADQDIAPEASRGLFALLQEERQFVLLSHEYWSRAVRDSELRQRYAERQARLREVLARALEARARQLGPPPFSLAPADVATAYIALAEGLSFQQLVDPGSVPEHLYGEILALVYQGLVARAQKDAPS
jgi:AcrR family transcriptional regulator